MLTSDEVTAPLDFIHYKSWCCCFQHQQKRKGKLLFKNRNMKREIIKILEQHNSATPTEE